MTVNTQGVDYFDGNIDSRCDSPLCQRVYIAILIVKMLGSVR